MTVLRGGVILSGSLIGLALFACNARACSCPGPAGAKTMREVAEWYAGGPNAGRTIFEGTVEKQQAAAGPIGAPRQATSTSTPEQHRVVSLRVLRSYRGDVAGMVSVLTGSGNGDCGFDFDTGSQYLVYADEVEEGVLVTGIYAGTSLLAHADSALRALRGEPPAQDDLLDAETYYKKFAPLWTATVCGQVTNSDGVPLEHAWVQMSQVRDEPFAANTAADSDQSKPDGSFCIRYIRPGKYLLTAERLDAKDLIRWAGYYPWSPDRSQAKEIEVHAAENLAGLHFGLDKVRVHTVLFRIVTSDRSRPPLEALGVTIDPVGPDALAYRLKQPRNINGEFPAEYVPPGNYVVQTYVRPGLKNGKLAAELAKWRMARREMYIATDSEIVLKLSPAN
jgi:hypothetical protein